MAEDKKSFLLYADTISTAEALTDEEAGLLFKHILRYVNDENPVSENRLVTVAFEHIKAQLKRDLQKWEKLREKRAENGKKGGEAKASNTKQQLANLPVSASVSASVSVISKKRKSKDFTPPILEEVIKYFKENGYTESSAEKAFKHYELGEWYNSHGKKVKNWKQTMNSVWFREENKAKPESNDPNDYEYFMTFDRTWRDLVVYKRMSGEDPTEKTLKRLKNARN